MDINEIYTKLSEGKASSEDQKEAAKILLGLYRYYAAMSTSSQRAAEKLKEFDEGLERINREYLDFNRTQVCKNII